MSDDLPTDTPPAGPDPAEGRADPPEGEPAANAIDYVLFTYLILCVAVMAWVLLTSPVRPEGPREPLPVPASKPAVPRHLRYGGQRFCHVPTPAAPRRVE